MTIAIGDKLPDATFKTMTPDGAKDMTTSEIFAGKRSCCSACPAPSRRPAATTTCPAISRTTTPSSRKGVDTIAVVAVNDHHVMGAWARFTGGEGKILYLADGNGDFAKATGLDGDMSGAGMGLRNKRFSMIVDDGKVTTLNVETKPGVNDRARRRSSSSSEQIGSVSSASSGAVCGCADIELRVRTVRSLLPVLREKVPAGG